MANEVDFDPHAQSIEPNGITNVIIRECFNCSQIGANKRCSGCNQTFYCSKSCQADHWPSHKKQCKKLRKSQKNRNGIESNSKNTNSASSGFAENIRHRTLLLQKRQRTPKLQVSKARNGTIKIQILNAFLVQNCRGIHFQLDYHFNDRQWQSTYFDDKTVNKRGEFWLKYPVKLYPYSMRFRLRAMYHDDEGAGDSKEGGDTIISDESNELIHCNQSNDDSAIPTTEWFEWSKKYSFSIPSSLIDMPYEVGDLIRYRSTEAYYANGYGKVIEILDDYHLRIVRNDGEKLIIAANRAFPGFEITTYNVVDISRGERSEDPQSHFAIDRNLILRNYSAAALDLYVVLKGIYREKCYEYGMYGVERRDSINGKYFGNIGEFMAKHVTQYLYPPQFKWKVGCRLDHRHGMIRCDDMRTFMLKCHLDGHRQAVIRDMKIDEAYKWCDLCYVRMNKFDSIYFCETIITDSHDYCLSCINIMITQHEELQSLLNVLLNSADDDVSSVNVNCIELMADYVIGWVRRIRS